MAYGELIKGKRKSLGLSAETVAEKAGISPATIYRYENGSISNPRMEVLRKIANVLHVDAYDLVDWDDEVVIDGQSSPLSRDEQDLVDVYRAVDDHGRKIIRTVADLEFERWRDELAKDDQKRE